jgi:uncharacterized protein YndB with AHSA1/START domain
MGVEISKLHVRRSSFINASPARVWEEFTSFEKLKAWFGRGHVLLEYEPKLGGRMELTVDLDGEICPYGGRVIAFEPGRELSATWNWRQPVRAWPTPALLTIRITPLYDGSLAEIFHHGFERYADAADQLEGYEQGWDMKHLTALRQIVEG